MVGKMVTLLESTNFVIGVMGLRCVVFECASMEDVNAIRRVYSQELEDGYYYRQFVQPHCGLAVYTKDEWINGVYR